MTKENNELVVYDQNKFVEILTEKTGDSFIEKLEKETAEFIKTSDMSTLKGRKAINSFSYGLSKYKAPLKAGKLKITEKVRKILSDLNEEDNRLTSEIQKLQDLVRQPLTDFENKEKERIEVRQNRIKAMENILVDTNCGESISRAMDKLDELMSFNDNWGEFGAKADNVFLKMNSLYKDMVLANLKRKAEQAELEKLRKEKFEKEQKEREDQIVKEAAEKARADERQKAADLLGQQEQAKYKLEAEKKAAEQAKIKAESDALIAQEIAEQERKRAKIQAEIDKDVALKQEREKLKLQKEKEIEEAMEREADIKHRTKINNEALDELGTYLLGNSINTPDDCRKKCIEIITAIAKGEIPHVSIKY